MKLLHWIAWTGMIAVIAVMAYYGRAFNKEPEKRGIICLEFANEKKGSDILHSWRNTEYGSSNVLEAAKVHTYIDFVFLIFYAAVLSLTSWSRRRRETHPLIRSMLRMNIFLAVTAALLDVIENLILLQNMNRWNVPDEYVSTFWISFFKFLFIGIIIVSWLLSVIRGWLVRR
jgi:hypothetical protein